MSRSLNEPELEMLLASLIAMVGRANDKCACLERRVHQLEEAAREHALCSFPPVVPFTEDAKKM